MDKSCKACDHFQDIGHSLGICRRYPVYQNRGPNERCGEFTPIPYANPVPEMLALPVMQMTEVAKIKRKYTRKEKND